MFAVYKPYTEFEFYTFKDPKNPQAMVKVDSINFTNTKVTLKGQEVSSTSFVAEPMQAIAALYKHGVVAFKSKSDARETAQLAGLGSQIRYLEMDMSQNGTNFKLGLMGVTPPTIDSDSLFNLK
jgi:hypothetical protein